MLEEDSALLWDMLNSGRELQQFLKGRRFTDLETDRMFRLAVEREIEIIGIAASKLSAGFREAYPEIPLHRIIAQRNVIAHEYGDIQLDRIWRVATERVPDLIRLLEPLIPPAPEEPGSPSSA